MVLADLGADVVRVERLARRALRLGPPGATDVVLRAAGRSSRISGDPRGGHSYWPWPPAPTSSSRGCVRTSRNGSVSAPTTARCPAPTSSSRGCVRTSRNGSVSAPTTAR
ncbi:hypothetical protein ACIQVL_23055 [Streptomyces sp. NPDC090499]|uniref:hypothetical protein n=1 Tax=Streptomyces sp. NPDC090499 TaxID=3365965 RepID=UPI00381B973B